MCGPLAVTGLAAIGGNANLSNFSIGDLYVKAADPKPYTPPSVRNDFIVDGVLSFSSGAVLSGGNLVSNHSQFIYYIFSLLMWLPCFQVYGSSASVISSRATLYGAGAKIQGHVLDFPTHYAGVKATQNHLSALPANGEFMQVYSGLYLHATRSPAVFNIPAIFVSARIHPHSVAVD